MAAEEITAKSVLGLGCYFSLSLDRGFSEQILNVFGKFCCGVLENSFSRFLWAGSVPQTDSSGVGVHSSLSPGIFGFVPSPASPPLVEMRCQEGREERNMNHLDSNGRNEVFV